MIRVCQGNQKGMTLVEVLVAAAIVVIAFVGVTSFVLAVKGKTHSLLISRSSSIQTQRLVQMLMSDPKLFRVNFDPSESSTCEVLRTSELPLAWDSENIYAVDECPTCAGRIGYTIQPFPIPIFRGLYVVTFRIGHPEITKGMSVMCDGAAIPDVSEIQMIVSLR